MKVKRGKDLRVEGDAAGALIFDERQATGEAGIVLDADELRWLMTTALPAILTAPAVTSEPREKVPEPPIAGQTTIDEVLVVDGR